MPPNRRYPRGNDERREHAPSHERAPRGPHQSHDRPQPSQPSRQGQRPPGQRASRPEGPWGGERPPPRSPSHRWTPWGEEGPRQEPARTPPIEEDEDANEFSDFGRGFERGVESEDREEWQRSSAWPGMRSAGIHAGRETPLGGGRLPYGGAPRGQSPYGPPRDPGLGPEEGPASVQRPPSWRGPHGPEPFPRFPRGPKGYKRSDERIREDVCDRIARTPSIDSSDVEVSVIGGEVTLAGSVPLRSMKWELEQLAESVFGVLDVSVQLKVRREGEPGATHSDK